MDRDLPVAAQPPVGPQALSVAAARTAHQLNGVLTVIGGNTELALLEGDGLGDPARHSLEQVLEACRRARELVRALQIRCREEAAADSFDTAIRPGLRVLLLDDEPAFRAAELAGILERL